jgi:hypothetical protein
MKRDGVVAKPPIGHGERSWWLTQIVEAAPLADWSAHLQGRSEAEIVALPVTDDWRADLHVAWSRAAIRQQNTTWAKALLGRPAAPVAETPERAAKLLGMLPAAERATWAAGFIRAQGLADAFRVLSCCAAPWPAPLAEVVLEALRTAAGRKVYPSVYSGVLALTARSLDPSDADRLLPLTDDPPAEEPATDRAGRWSQAFQQLTTTVQLRAAMRRELTDG